MINWKTFKELPKEATNILIKKNNDVCYAGIRVGEEIQQMYGHDMSIPQINKNGDMWEYIDNLESKPDLLGEFAKLKKNES